MRSQRILWALLAVAMAPPVLEGTLGCSFEPGRFPASGPIADNAVECECTFADEPGSQKLRIAAVADDAEQDGVQMDLFGTDLDLAQKHVGLRFDAAGLPAGAIIQSAYVQFTGDETQGQTTTVTIQAQADVAAPAFSTTDADITLRLPGTELVQWTIDPWTNSIAGTAERTPELKDLIQELVDLPGWSSASPVVLRISGSGHRTAESFDDHPDEAPQLVVTYTTGLSTTIPVCVDGATAVDRDANGHLLGTVMTARCTALATTLGGLNDACGLPSTAVSCTKVDRKDPNDADIADSFERSVCGAACPGDPVNGDCSDYDPVALVDCLEAGTSFETCKADHATATHAGTDAPICVASGSALAFHAFGQRSLCEVAGTSDIEIGDREPKKNPRTQGKVEYLGRPCPGGDCQVHPYFLLAMEPITFEVRWASDPTFGNLGAVGGGLETALLASGEAEFGADTIEGTGRGRRGSDGLAIHTTNSDPLVTGVDWSGRACDLIGTLGVGVGDDGVCEADGTTLCRSDADCAGVGGMCTLPADDAEAMSVGVALGGDLVNQPPTARAGADQTIECTSTAGASFVLNGRGSSDPDGNLALASWRAGTRTGTELANALVTEQALGVGNAQSYVLRVIDSLAQLDEDATNASVVDTTPPVIACNAPATIRPPTATIAFGATATDVCDASVAATVTGFDCFTFTKRGRRVSKLESCIVSFAGDTLTVHDVGGYGDHIAWSVEATDDSGNVGSATCEVVVAK